MKCGWFDILTLHITDIKNTSDFLLFITPFFNEFANLFTITLFLPIFKYNLYAHHPKSGIEIFVKSLIDLIALSGIAANSAYVASSEEEQNVGFQLGAVKGMLYLFFAFMIPNLFMEDFLSMLPNQNMIRLGIGILFIYILDVCVHSLYCQYYKRLKHKED